jgi:transposase-like protein
MNELTTEIIAALAQKQDLDEVFRHHLEIAINQLLQTELAEFLGYERYSYAGINTGNNRNGSYKRSVSRPCQRMTVFQKPYALMNFVQLLTK